jgi:ribosomal protein S14
LGFSAQSCQDGTEKPRGERLLGRIFAASRIKLREIAKHLGVRHLVN